MRNIIMTLIVLLLPLGALAQEDTKDDQKARARRAAQAEKLKARAFNLARRAKYEEAFTTFEQVLPLVDYPDDQVLFNLSAIAFEALKDCRRGLIYMHGYLYAAPGDSSAAGVRKRIARCTARLRESGSVVISSQPDNVEVRVNDVILGRTPLQPVTLPSGTWQIRAETMDYLPYRGEFIVDTALETRHRFSMKKRIYMGNLRVETEPPDAQVYLNEVKVGASPWERKQLPTRKYLVRIEKEGMDRWIRYVTVERGQTVTVKAKLEATGVNVPIPPIPSNY